MTEDCFKHSIIMQYQKLAKLLDATSDDVPRLITKNGLKFLISLGGHITLASK